MKLAKGMNPVKTQEAFPVSLAFEQQIQFHPSSDFLMESEF